MPQQSTAHTAKAHTAKAQSDPAARAPAQPAGTVVLPRIDGPPLRVRGHLASVHSGLGPAGGEIRLFCKARGGWAVAVTLPGAAGGQTRAVTAASLTDAMAFLEALAEEFQTAHDTPAAAQATRRRRLRPQLTHGLTVLDQRFRDSQRARDFAILAGEAMSAWQQTWDTG